MSPNRTRLTSPALAALALLAAGLILAACGGSSSPSEPASSAEDSALKFSKCMREHGIKDFPNPETRPGGGSLLKFNDRGVSRATLEAAQKACQHLQEEGGGPPELSPQERVEREEQVQRFAKCMREHGIEVEAQTSGGRIAIKVRGRGPKTGEPPSGKSAPKPSPALEAAQEACQGLLPGPKGGLRARAGGRPPSAEGSYGTQAQSGG